METTKKKLVQEGLKFDSNMKDESNIFRVDDPLSDVNAQCIFH